MPWPAGWQAHYTQQQHPQQQVAAYALWQQQAAAAAAAAAQMAGHGPSSGNRVRVINQSMMPMQLPAGWVPPGHGYAPTSAPQPMHGMPHPHYSPTAAAAAAAAAAAYGHSGPLPHVGAQPPSQQQ